jgi:pyruvate dehydrogenase E2 component (dihydrolipoamide acetyltransferase)
MGLTMTEGTVMRWLKQEGDRVSKGEPLLELMTDKVTVEVEAPASGTLSRVFHRENAVVPVGEPLAWISSPDEMAALAENMPEAEASKVTPVARSIATEAGIALHNVQGTGERGATREDVASYVSSSGEKTPAQASEVVRASPAARRVARELGVELAAVKGSGPDGRITEEDVRQSARTLTKAPYQDAIAAEKNVSLHVPPPSVETLSATLPVRGIRQVMAERMTTSFTSTPHFYLTVELDGAALLKLSQRFKKDVPETEAQITVTDLLVKFVAAALAEHPFANASWKDGAIERFNQVNIGIATATEQGLVVPVIKGADHLNLKAIAQARYELVSRARAGKLTMEDVSGGTFTISNLGMYGVDLFAGIINPPQSALLAIGRIKERPYGIDGQVRIHPTFYATLSVDHRVMDGAQAAILLQRIGELVEEPALLVL